MDAKVRAKITASTQDHLIIHDVLDDLAINKNGVISLIVQTTTVNFDLLSEQEQDNKIMAFSGLLNSLNFQIQVLIVTKRVKISGYVDRLQEQTNKITSTGLQRQLKIYTSFIQKLIVQNDVLDKKFYIVIPYQSTILPKEGEAGESLKKRMVEAGKINLYPKRDHILKQLNRMGLMGHQLTTNEIIDLLYNLYND